MPNSPEPQDTIKIMGMGINFSTGAPLFEPTDLKVFSENILHSLEGNIDEVRERGKGRGAAATFREVAPTPSPNLCDPKAAGWTFLVNGKDPQMNDIVEALQPLANRRGMTKPRSPLIYNGEGRDKWYDWLLQNYNSAVIEGVVPYYILIAGGPSQVPFHFQSFLSASASVGRVDFDTLDDLKTYVNKIIRLEEAEYSTVNNEAVVFATDYGGNDGTVASRKFMAEPIAGLTHKQYKLATNFIVGANANKNELKTALENSKPAFVFTAGHGMGDPGDTLSTQKAINGAICCELISNKPYFNYFSADDVPPKQPFLEGAIFFQFACNGYGTPAKSDFSHWIEKKNYEPQTNATEDFVAALPKKLLAHPRGPIGYIGHLDNAHVCGFVDKNPEIEKQWQPRMGPFIDAINALLQQQPAGYSMNGMNKRGNELDRYFGWVFNQVYMTKTKDVPKPADIALAFITRSDAENYMVFGDPAARLRLP